MSVFFLTGSSRGLGRAIAEAALDAGHQLVATARNPESLDVLVAGWCRALAEWRAVRMWRGSPGGPPDGPWRPPVVIDLSRR